jgi:hypothetical protein
MSIEYIVSFDRFLSVKANCIKGLGLLGLNGKAAFNVIDTENGNE